MAQGILLFAALNASRTFILAKYFAVTLKHDDRLANSGEEKWNLFACVIGNPRIGST